MTITRLKGNWQRNFYFTQEEKPNPLEYKVIVEVSYHKLSRRIEVVFGGGGGEGGLRVRKTSPPPTSAGTNCRRQSFFSEQMRLYCKLSVFRLGLI